MPLIARMIIFTLTLTAANAAFGMIVEADFGAVEIGKILLFIVFAFAVNIPFGSYRNLTRKFSIAWWLSIHLPIPFIIVLRTVMFHLPLWIIPASLASAVFGQIIGSKVALFGERELDAKPEGQVEPGSV